MSLSKDKYNNIKKYGLAIGGLAFVGAIAYKVYQKLTAKEKKKKENEESIVDMNIVTNTNTIKYAVEEDNVEEIATIQKNFLAIMEHYSDNFNKSKICEFMIPREFSESTLKATCNELNYTDNHCSNDIDAITRGISIPVWDLLDRGGKKWRPILCIFTAEAFGKTMEDILEIAGLCEVIHNGSLILDDIEDKSDVRRNKKCIHKIYGDDISINTGCYMYFIPFKKLLESPKYTPKQKDQFTKIYFEEMVNIHFGQNWDIYWHNLKDMTKLPNEYQYLQMTAHKTGVLARMSMRLTCTALDIPLEKIQALSYFAEKIGVAFQIQDDILNLVGEEYVKTKGYGGEDIHEGKITLIVIDAMKKLDIGDRDRLWAILQMHTDQRELIEEALVLLKKTGSIEYAQSVAVRLIDEAWDSVKNYIPPSKAKHYLRALGRFFVDRKL